MPLSKLQLHSFWTSLIDGNERSTSRPSCFTPGKNHGTITHWTGGWVCPKVGLDCCGEEKISCLYCDSNPRSSSLKVYLTFDKSKDNITNTSPSERTLSLPTISLISCHAIMTLLTYYDSLKNIYSSILLLACMHTLPQMTSGKCSVHPWHLSIPTLVFLVFPRPSTQKWRW